MLKLRTSPAFAITVAAALALSLISAVTNVLLPIKHGDPAIGSRAHVAHVLNQPGAVVSMAMFILGAASLPANTGNAHPADLSAERTWPGRGGQARYHRTARGGPGRSRLCDNGRGRRPGYAHKGVHTLPVDMTSLGLGTVLSGACYGLLGVAIGALTRNTVGAIITGLIWLQVVEVGILENAIPSMAKWLPAGAAQGLTAVARSASVLPPAEAAIVLVGWASVLVAAATRLSIRRELR